MSQIKLLEEGQKGMLRQGGKSTSFVSGSRKTIHTNFEDGSELVEEYDVKTDELLGKQITPPATPPRRHYSWTARRASDPVSTPLLFLSKSFDIKRNYPPM